MIGPPVGALFSALALRGPYLRSDGFSSADFRRHPGLASMLRHLPATVGLRDEYRVEYDGLATLIGEAGWE